jgi:hypothetical protein
MNNELEPGVSSMKNETESTKTPLDVTKRKDLTDSELKEMWKVAGGEFYGPNVETGSMPEFKLLPFLRSLIQESSSGTPFRPDLVSENNDSKQLKARIQQLEETLKYAHEMLSRAEVRCPADHANYTLASVGDRIRHVMARISIELKDV